LDRILLTHASGYSRWIVAGVLCCLACGCTSATTATTQQAVGGEVLLIPGIAGQESHLRGVRQGLREAGLSRDIDVFTWGSSPLLAIRNLMDLPANRKRAEEMAARLVAFRREHPNEPLTLVGFSGGGGLAILCAEILPDGIMLDRIILVAGAISQDYDLSKVLSHCKDGLINFYSDRDAIVGWGTAVFGTIDRKQVFSAGHSGFVDEAGRLRRQEKLVQIPWSPAWTQYGHYGGHIGYLSPSWARHILAAQIDPSLAALLPSK
jgi:pimeloyl-ACP methyl ester carboxylesterase